MPVKLLICTMLTNDFRSYAAGAAKIAAAVRTDAPRLQRHLNVWTDTAILEMQERPLPPSVWNDLHAAGWQRKITRPRIPPRNEGREVTARFAGTLVHAHAHAHADFISESATITR